MMSPPIRLASFLFIVLVCAGCGSGSSTQQDQASTNSPADQALGSSPSDPSSSGGPSEQSSTNSPPVVDPGSSKPSAPVSSNTTTLLAARLGEATTLTAPTAPGSPSYQWLLNGYAITGATSATYTVPAVTCADAAKVYRSFVIGSAGSALGDSIVLRPTGCPIALVAGAIDSPFPWKPLPNGAFRGPWALTPGPNGAMFVGDIDALKSVTVDGSVKTLVWPAALAASNGVYAVASDGAGNFFLTDNIVIRKFAADGAVSIIAGAYGAFTPPQVDGPRAVARFQSPRGLAVDKAGNLYVSDEATLRKIAPDGTVSTLAGKAQQPGSVDGVGALARFTALRGLAIDSAGTIFAVDEAGTIRRVTPDGVVSTLAGVAGQRGLVDGQGTAARFNAPQGIAIEANGNLLVADGANDCVRRVTRTGEVTTLPFVVATPKSIDWVVTQDAPAFVSGIAIDSTQTIWLSAPFAGVVFKVVEGVGAQVVAGTYEPSGLGIVDELGAKARFGDGVKSMVAAADGKLYVADSSTVRSVDDDGYVRTIAGWPDATGAIVDGKGFDARFGNLWGLVLDPSGALIALDGSSLRKVAPDGSVTTLRSYAWLPGYAASLTGRGTAAMDARGTLFAAVGCELWSALPDGTVKLVWGSFDNCRGSASLTPEPSPIQRVAVAPDNTLFVFSEHRLTRMTTAGVVLATWDEVFVNANFFSFRPPIAFDSAGRAYVSSNDGVVRISPSGTLDLVTPWPISAETGRFVQVCNGGYGFSGWIADWAFDRNDKLFALCNRGLYRINMAAP